MEENILNQLDTDIELLECLEPGNEQFEQLKHVQFKADQVNFHHQEFNEETSEINDKFDVITMFHVHYYWTTPEQREKVMQKLFQDHLNPKGLLFILLLNDGINNQVQLRREVKQRLIFEKPRHYQSVTLFTDQLVSEINQVIKDCDAITAKQQHHYNVTLDLDLASTAMLQSNSITQQLISYILSVRFADLPKELQNFALDWIKDNCQHVQDEIFQVQQAVSMLVYEMV